MLAHVGGIYLHGDAHGLAQLFKDVTAPADEAERGSARRVVLGECLADAAGRAGEEDAIDYLSFRAIAMRPSTTVMTRSEPPAAAAEVTYLPFTTIIGTPSTL